MMDALLRNLPWCLLALALWLLLLGMNFFVAESNWVDVEAVVSPYGGTELQFYEEEWEPLSTVLHLSPPAGEPAWQPGQKVAISYYRSGAGGVVLRADKPAARSLWVLLSGCLLFFVGVPLAFLFALCRNRRHPTPPAAEQPSSGCLLSFMRCLGDACCVVAAAGLSLLIAELCYNPDSNAALALGFGAIPFWLSAGGLLLVVSRALQRCARSRQQAFTQE